MSPVCAANMVANSDNTAYGVEIIRYIERVIGSASSRLRWNAGSVLDLASSWTREAGSSLNGKSCKPLAKTKMTKKIKKTKKLKKTKTNIRVATWNVGTLKGKDAELVETQSRRGVASVLCRNAGLKVPLGPTRFILSLARTANSSYSVHKLIQCC